jgi:hypothetical protein
MSPNSVTYVPGLYSERGGGWRAERATGVGVDGPQTASKGYRIVRLWNADINRDPDAAADTVLAVLNGEDPLG